ncbi:lipopolysaccharide biosynthesis [Maritimibacter sp. 55A14]|uniref:GumC family protein n=1 Tax=Maritimibacter sp. 55A14 TaxID=2174844 RepID=UPI000D60F2F3|nr:lipopolysaccharide biosynthesis [Maritimibacter sp. 55A14]PWE32983.1 lipopolysaccharide biosynthesis [Maritimibacter sp. 55A14]
MDNIRFYLSIFIRRLPYFLAVATVVSAVSVIVAKTLPPAYVSQMRLIVESPQIPTNLAPSTVATPALEQLQIVEQRLLTRPNLLDIANRLKVMPDQDRMNPDQIVDGMRARTQIRTSAGRGQATLMQISFEAISAQNAAGVLNEYLTEIQQEDVEYRKGRAIQTLEFFEQEVDRLSDALEKRSAAILTFKQNNSDALPASLPFRETQQAALQTNLEQIDRQIFSLESQREKLMEVYNSTGQVVGTANQNLSPAEQQLQQLRAQLNNDLVVYSETNPRIKLLRARIASLEESVAAQQAAQPTQSNTQTGNSALDIQLAQLDAQLITLKDQKKTLEERIAKLTDSIQRTPANAVTLDDLQRDYDNIQAQYNTAVARLSAASTGERIEVMSRGQRISVVEQPAVPSAPTKPNRMLIAGGGTAFGILLGLALVLLLEFLNRTPRRPEDLINKLEVWPIATIPYVQTRSEVMVRRIRRLLLVAVILVGIPAAVWAVHTYYQPLDLIADRVMDKLGMRW